VWIRQTGRSKPPEIRLYWWTDQGFEFDSDWKPRAEIDYRGFAGHLEMNVDRKASTPDQLLIRFRREQDGVRSSHLVETGDVRLQRLGDMGWELVWIQDPLKTLVTVGEPLEPGQERVEKDGQRLWVFQKASHRQLPLDEIPGDGRAFPRRGRSGSRRALSRHPRCYARTERERGSER